MKHREGQERGVRAWPARMRAGLWRRHQPLSYRLLAAVLAASLVLAVATTLLDLALDYHRDLEALKTELWSVQRHAEQPLAEALAGGERASIERELVRLLQFSPVFYAQVVASDGRHYEAGRPVTPAGDRLQRTFKLERRLPDGRRLLLGSAHLEASTALFKSRLFDRFLLTAGLVMLRLLLLSLFLLWCFRRLVSRHLAVIAAQMRRTTSLNLREPLLLARHPADDEIHELVQSFNLMRRNMQHELEIREAHDRSLAAEHELCQQALLALPLPLLRCCPEGTVVWLNPAAEQLCGRGLAGKRLAQLLPVVGPGGEDAAEGLFRRARAGTSPVSGRLLLATPAGTQECMAQATLLRAADGSVAGVLLLVQAPAMLPQPAEPTYWI